MLNRSDFLTAATNIVTKDRNLQYGEPEDAFALIAEYWSVYLGQKYRISITLLDAAMLMELMKIARLTNNPLHEDSVIDAIGYMACYGEIASKLQNLQVGPTKNEQ